MKVLFLTESREDYLADGLLHGLISLQSIDVTDYPRKSILYRGGGVCPSSPELGVRGNGFSLYGLLPDRPVDRSFVIQRLERGDFDLVVLGQIWRQWGQLMDLAPWLQRVPVVLLDGDDDPRLFHRSATRIRRYGWQPFPIRSGRCLYLKREWHGEGRHSRQPRIREASFSIPAEKIRRAKVSSKTKEFASHCVDAEVANALGLHQMYAFSSEDAYYDDLANSRFAITTRRGGWDCLRHYEIAAAGSVPCVRQLVSKPSPCAPHGLVAGVNCLSYSNWSDLERQIKRLDANAYARLLEGAQRWIAAHTTAASARDLLDLVSTL